MRANRFRTFRKAFAAILCLLLASASYAQSPVRVQRPEGSGPFDAYKPTVVPPVRTSNSARLDERIRAGKLYLTVQDALALALANNLDLEISRYGPLLAEWQGNRAQAGGALRGVPSGSSQIGQVASGQGVAGSQQSAGVSSGGAVGSGGGAGGAAVSQIGPVTANLDPVIQGTTAFSHTTSPQVNTRQSLTTALVSRTRIYHASVQQGLLSGGFVQAGYRHSYLRENAPTNILNPSTAPRMNVYLQHNLLRGFGAAVNSRFIRIAEKNTAGAGESFRSEVIDLTVRVLNLYWGMVVDLQTIKSRERALEIAARVLEDTRKSIAASALSRVDIYRPEAEVGIRKRELGEARAALRQRENQFKNAISRDGIADPSIESVEIVPVDTIQVPAEEELPPLRKLLETAIKKRPDVAAARLRLENAETSALGTSSGILPELAGIAQGYTSGLSGAANPFRGVGPNPDLVGGLGTALSQVFRFSYPNARATAFIQGNVNNRIRQGDHGIDQLQLRQTELRNLRDLNQIVVDISNQVVALRQARARYNTAVHTRQLQQELLEKSQRMFTLGSLTLNELINAQRNLVNAEASEVAALGAYVRARIGLDQVLGETLERNGISSGAWQ
jgi:outer membrane protein TolC